MTKKNLIIVIVLLAIIDLLAAGWYTSRRIEASGRSQNLFDQRDSTEVIAMADTVTNSAQADVFEDLQHNTYYYIANTPVVKGDNSTCYTCIKHVKTRWPKKVNGDDELVTLNKELISKAFGNTQSKMKDARYVYLNTPVFNMSVGEDYHKLTSAPKIVPTYGHVSQVLVYPYLTSDQLLVMEVDKFDYNGNVTIENNSYIHYDRDNQRILTRLDILSSDYEKENKLLKLINRRIDNLNDSRGDSKLLHALNVPAEICCSKKGIIFQYKHGSISSGPIEILIDYDKLEPYLTKEFLQLIKDNDNYAINKEKIEPEAINPTPKSTALTTNTTTVKKKKKAQQYNSNADQYKSYRYNKKYYSKPRHTKRRHYNGVKHKSAHYGNTGQRHWKRRRH